MYIAFVRSRASKYSSSFQMQTNVSLVHYLDTLDSSKVVITLVFGITDFYTRKL